MSYCGMSERCKLYDPESEKSQKLGRYHKSTICDRCWAAGYRPEDAPNISDNQVGAGDYSADEPVVCSQCGNEPVVASFNTETDDRPLCEECRERLLEQWQTYGFLTF